MQAFECSITGFARIDTGIQVQKVKVLHVQMQVGKAMQSQKLSSFVQIKLIYEDEAVEYTVSDVLEMEICICELLDWKLNLTTPDQLALTMSVTCCMTSSDEAQKFLGASNRLLRLILAGDVCYDLDVLKAVPFLK